jgi:Flp pilus assembly protein TadG
VEGALILLPLFAILLAIIDFSMALFLRATMQNAVREGVRFAVTYQTFSGMCQDASIRKVVKDSAAGFLSAASYDTNIKVRYYAPANLTLEVTGANSNSPGNVVEIGVEGYTYSWIAPLWRTSSPFNINVYAADRMEGLPGGVSPPCR